MNKICSGCGCVLQCDNKKGEGCYMCTKRNQEMYADTPECYMFEPGTRGQVESEKLYDEAKEAKKKAENSKTGEIGGLLVIAILLLIGAVIVNVFFLTFNFKELISKTSSFLLNILLGN